MPKATPMEWRSLKAEIAYSCSGFDIVSERIELPDGTRTDFDYLSEDESVVILPFIDDERVVVIDEWRQAVRRVNRGLPAGSLEGDERPRQAVERELAEETGYEPGRVEHMTSVEPANGFADAVFHYFVASDCTPTATVNLDTDETIEPTTTTFEALLEAIREGELRDGRSAFGVLAYLLHEGRV